MRKETPSSGLARLGWTDHWEVPLYVVTISLGKQYCDLGVREVRYYKVRSKGDLRNPPPETSELSVGGTETAKVVPLEAGCGSHGEAAEFSSGREGEGLSTSRPAVQGRGGLVKHGACCFWGGGVQAESGFVRTVGEWVLCSVEASGETVAPKPVHQKDLECLLKI